MTVTYTYDEKGNLIKEAGLEDNPSSSRWYYERFREYTYNDAGQVTSVQHYTLRYDRGEIDHKYDLKIWEYQYDGNGQMTQVSYSNLGSFDENGESTSGGSDYVIYGTPTYGIFYVYTPGEEIEYNR